MAIQAENAAESQERKDRAARQKVVPRGGSGDRDRDRDSCAVFVLLDGLLVPRLADLPLNSNMGPSVYFRAVRTLRLLWCRASM